MGTGCLGAFCDNLCIKCLLGMQKAGNSREMRVRKVTDKLLIVGTVNPRVLLFLGIVTRKYIFLKICVWSSDLN